MFITENYEQRKQNDEIRMQIIQCIMNIYDTKRLENIFVIANCGVDKEYFDHPMRITDIAEQFDLLDIVHILDAMRHMDFGNARAYQQMYKAFGDALDVSTGADQEGE
jgi:hypothetical protein